MASKATRNRRHRHGAAAEAVRAFEQATSYIKLAEQHYLKGCALLTETERMYLPTGYLEMEQALHAMATMEVRAQEICTQECYAPLEAEQAGD